MKTENCLIAGFPGTGKSSYITALWAVEKEGRTNHKLYCKDIPEDTQYLDKMHMQWLTRQEIDRTSFASIPPINLLMHSDSLDSDIVLSIPDFMGEVFEKVLQGATSDNLNHWMRNCNIALVFMTIADMEYFSEEIDSMVYPNTEKDIIEFDGSKMSSSGKTILLLKYLKEHMKLEKVAICVSAIDEKMEEVGTDGMDAYMRVRMPLLYNYVEANFSNYMYFGVSAQGVDYTKISAEELMRKTQKNERAYVYLDHIDYDITLPLDYLIKV